MGDTPANVCFNLYQLDPFDTSGSWLRSTNYCFTLAPHTPSSQAWVEDRTSSYGKITTDSEFCATSSILYSQNRNHPDIPPRGF